MDKKRKKNNIVIVICLLVLVLLVGVLLIVFTKQSTDGKTKKSTKKEIIYEEGELDDNQKKVQELSRLFNDYLIDPTKDSHDYAELTGSEPQNFEPMLGVGSVHYSDFSTNFKNDYNEELPSDVLDYVQAFDDYNKNLNKAVSDTFSLKLKGAPLYTEDKKQLMQQVEVIPFSYILYKRDLMEIRNEIIKLAKPDFDLDEERPEVSIFLFKTTVKAMQILDLNMEEYKNKKKQNANMIYDISDEDKITCNNCHFYINDAQGFYLEEVKVNGVSDNYAKARDDRINKIISKAVKKKVLNKKKPLEIY